VVSVNFLLDRREADGVAEELIGWDGSFSAVGSVSRSSWTSDKGGSNSCCAGGVAGIDKSLGMSWFIEFAREVGTPIETTGLGGLTGVFIPPEWDAISKLSTLSQRRPFSLA